MQKIRKIGVGLTTVLVCAAVWSVLHSGTPLDRVSAYVEKNADSLAGIAAQVCSAQSAAGVQYPEVEAISYLPDPSAVDFRYRSAGGAASSVYYGFYYAAEERPVGFQGTEMPLTETADGWMWQEPDGDNWYRTKAVLPHWYVYEMHF